MTRGKYAARSENTRSDRLQAEVDRLKAELNRVTGEATTTANRLNEQIGELKRDILVKAAEMAAPEIERRTAEMRAEQEKLGLTLEATRAFMAQMEYLVFNACRYVSMTTGKHPVEAMQLVITWITGQPHRAVVDPEKWLISRGLPANGWMRGMLGFGGTATRENRKRDSHKRPAAWPLDDVEASPEDFSAHLHPDYRPHWYPTEKRPPQPGTVSFEKKGARS